MTKKCTCLVALILSFIVFIHTLILIADFRQSAEIQTPKFPRRNQSDVIVPDETTDRLFWFVQLSDLHLSKFDDRGRTPDFSQLCLVHIRVIAPEMVIVTGDITDAKFPRMWGSQQFKKEWEVYGRIVKESGISERTIWLDLRGNHDNFNVPSITHPTNYFRQYSVAGPNSTQSYMFTLRKSFGSYSFIGLDACPSPGLKRPHNFFGLITPTLRKSLQYFSDRASGSNHTFWFGHYPTSTIISTGFDLREFIGRTAYCYMCGHLHTLLNMVPRMYTVQPQGYLELELADWRDGRFFRIMAVDNDLVAFVDCHMHNKEAQDWPILLITNPKDAAFLLNHKEPTYRILQSTHIRILAWSVYPITRVSVTVDGKYLGDAKPAVHHYTNNAPNSPLFVLAWDPVALWKRGPPPGTDAHSITVVCEDLHNNTRTVQQSFTLDGTPRWSFGGIQSFILLNNHMFTLMLLFYLVWSVPFLSLLIARLFGTSHLYDRVCEDFCQLKGLREIAKCNFTFNTLVGYLVYVLCGPIFMGYLVENSFGFAFTFGLLVHNIFIPEGTTYMIEIIQQLIFVYPLILLLIHRMYISRKPRCGIFCRCCCLSRNNSELLVMCLLTTTQLFFTVSEVLLPYGWTAFFLSPGRLWLIALAWLLFIHIGWVIGRIRSETYSKILSR